MPSCSVQRTFTERTPIFRRKRTVLGSADVKPLKVCPPGPEQSDDQELVSPIPENPQKWLCRKPLRSNDPDTKATRTSGQTKSHQFAEPHETSPGGHPPLSHRPFGPFHQ